MPRFALFAADFMTSNSNRIWYRNYTTSGSRPRLGRRVGSIPQFRQTVYETENAQALYKPITRSVEADSLLRVVGAIGLEPMTSCV
jgi:hypothetical protein